jgi:PAS domain S-box-containing protein
MNQKITPEKTLPTILIVDDTPANIGVISESLEERGYRVLVAQDGEEGLQRAGFVQPDLILLDVMMPGLDGFEVCRRLKKETKTRDIPVIFMTARTETEDKVAGFKAGGVDYVTKPLQIDEVIARVETQINLSAMQKRLETQNSQLQRYREQLEQRVAERTDELSVTNQRLRGEIQERKHVEENLIAREREFRTLAENMPDNICRYDHECRLIYMNPVMASTLSLVAREGIGKTQTEAVPPGFPDISEYQAQIAKVIASSQPCEIEMTLPDTGHGVRFHHVRFVAERGTQGEVVGVLAIGRDITEIKQAERDLEESRVQLRGLTARREEAREEERKHIAREVHDELGQILTGLQLNISVLAYKFAADLPPLREHLQETKVLTDNALSVARNVATALRPAALDMGIASALEWLAERFSANSGIQCQMHIEDSELQLEESHAIALFRIVQESLTNVARYAKASRVDITLNKDEDEYVLQVRDNGKGFDASVKKSDSFGLVGIRERALMLGGECSINSSPGKGTEVLVRIPVRYH